MEPQSVGLLPALRQRWSFMAILATLSVLAASVLTFVAPAPAKAAGNEDWLILLVEGSPDSVKPGESFSVELGFSIEDIVGGATRTFAFDSPIVLPEKDALDFGDANGYVDDYSVNGNSLTITFRAPTDAELQGEDIAAALGFKLSIDANAEPSKNAIPWRMYAESTATGTPLTEGEIEVGVDEGDNPGGGPGGGGNEGPSEPANPDTVLTKNGSRITLSEPSDITVNDVTGEVKLTEAGRAKVTGAEFDWTVTAQPKGVADYKITDTMTGDKKQTYKTDSFALKVVGADGSQHTYTSSDTELSSILVIAGNNKSFDLDLSGFDPEATFTLTYSTTPDAGEIANFIAGLEREEDTDRGDGSGIGLPEFVVSNGVSASFTYADDTPGTKTGTGEGRIATPNIGDVKANLGFNKTYTGTFEGKDHRVEYDPKNDDPQFFDASYQFKANLKNFTGTWDGEENPYSKLNSDVIFTDTYPDVFLEGADNVELTLDADADVAGTFEFAQVTVVTDATEAEIKTAIAEEGQWTVVGRTVYVNLGRNNANNFVFNMALKGDAQVLYEGLYGGVNPGDTTNVKTTWVSNTANVGFTDAGGTQHNEPSTVSTELVPSQGENTVKDDQDFQKRFDSRTERDGFQWLTYVFDWKRKNVDASTLEFTDHLDAQVFDLAKIQSQITDGKLELTARVNDQINVPASFITAALDGSDLTFSLLPDLFDEDDFTDHAGQPVKWTLTLPTLIGKNRDVDVTNTASVSGEDMLEDYAGGATQKVDSWGNTLQLTKEVSVGGSGDFSKGVRLPEGSTQANFVYKIVMTPRGGYNMPLPAIVDELPDGVEFLGLSATGTGFNWNAAIANEDARPSKLELDTKDNKVRVTANFVDGKVNLTAVSRTTRMSGDPVVVYIMAHVPNVDDLTDQPVVNKLSRGNTPAVVTYSDKFPLVVSKLNSSDENTVITDLETAEFKVFKVAADTETEVTKAGATIRVENGLLKWVDNTTKKTSPLLVDEKGEYVVKEITPPAGYGTTLAPDLPITVSDAGGFGDMYDTAEPSVSVGDYVWFDPENDGRQASVDDTHSAEFGISGVVLRILGPDGQPAKEITGHDVPNAVTGADGYYSFDQLPVLGTDEHYTVQIVKDDPRTVEALKNYTPTKKSQGDRVGDSDTWEAVTDNTKVDLTKDGARDDTLDFGFFTKSYAVGDVVWIDTNRDGIQDFDGATPEETLPGVKVDLFVKDSEGNFVQAKHVDGSAVGQETTDVNGRYLFDNLPTGTYKVKFTLSSTDSAKYLFTKYTNDLVPADKDATADSNAEVTDDPAVGESAEFTLNDYSVVTDDAYTDQAFSASQGIDPTWDAGVVLRSYAIGDKVWIDFNRDGAQSDGEQPLEGTGVELLVLDEDTNEYIAATDVKGAPVPATTTDENGLYLFDNLPAGTYKVKFTLTEDQAAIYDFTTPLVEETGEDDDAQPVTVGQDSDADKATGLTEVITLGAVSSLTTLEDYEGLPFVATEGIDPTWDAGVVRKRVSVGDYVWIDLNHDGLHDAAETAEEGIDGVTLHLSLVDDLGKVLIADDQVTDVDGHVVGSQTTKNSGKYLFDNLPVLKPGQQYKVTIGNDPTTLDALADYVPTDLEQGTDRSKDSSTASALAPASGLLVDGAKDLTLDFGFVRKAVSVGDYVWVDKNRNGTQDEGDPSVAGIEGVKLLLTDKDGNEVTDTYGKPVGPTWTNEEGHYEFINLPALKEDEKYIVKIDHDDPDTEEVLAPYLPTIEGENGGEGANDSSTDKAVATHEGLTEDGDFNITLDFGFVLRSYAIGDKVWIDTDRQGDQNEDTVLKGVKVELFEQDGVTPAKDVFGKDVPEVYTNDQGRYKFDNLPAGTYKVKFTLTKEQSEVYRFTTNTDSAASNEATDSDTNVDSSNLAVAVTSDIVLGPDNAALDKSYKDVNATEGIDPTWDAGVVHKRVSVGTFVWVDADRDGKHAVDEDPDVDEGIGNVLLKLSIVDDDGNEVTPAGEILDIYNNVVTDLRTADGSDPDEARGHYLFTNLRALNTGQHYKVSIDFDDPQTKEALSEYVATTPGDGSDKGLDSSVGSETTKGTDLQTDGAEDLSLDFGFHKPSFAIGDLVWIDLNGNGIQDETEKPLEGVTVTLLDAATGEPVEEDVQHNPISPITVGEDGRYLFDNLPAGTYKVKFELTPEQGLKYQFTDLQSKNATESVDDSDGIVENTTALTAVTREITLDLNNSALKSQAEYIDEDFADFDGTIVATHGIDPTWDAGVMPKSVSVGDLVWEDLNHDGTQDKNEPGIKDVLLFLTDKDGNPVKDIFGDDVPPVYTDENGYYSFDNLPALKEGEEYQVHIFAADELTAKVLKPYKPTNEGENGGSGEFDSSTLVAVATSEGLTENGNRNPTLDFGFVKKAVSVGDKVWFDKNKNGIQDDGEPGIPDVKLILTDKDGNPVHDVYGKPVKPIWTGPNGEYEFTDLPTLEPGQEYRVKIDTTDKKSREALKDLMPTSAKSGKDRGLDSDTWVAIATSEGLTEDGDHNPTLDFGFVPVELPDAGSEPDGLSQTGFGGLPAAGFGALLAVGGVLLILGTRRRQRR